MTMSDIYIYIIYILYIYIYIFIYIIYFLVYMKLDEIIVAKFWIYFKGHGMSQGESSNKKHKNITEFSTFLLGIYTQGCI